MPLEADMALTAEEEEFSRRSQRNTAGHGGRKGWIIVISI